MTANNDSDSDLRELYQDLILDHGRKPRNFRVPETKNREALGHNPLCGDRLVLYLNVENGDVIRDAAFQGSGCAISTASASMMTEMLRGKSVAEARCMFERFRAMCTGCAAEKGGAFSCDDCDERLAALAGVRNYPMRVKCATLPWHTMISALENQPSGSAAASMEGRE